MSGGLLASVKTIDGTRRDRRLDKTEILVACDVDNPLTGPHGAAAVYGPQKGAEPEQVRLLDEGLGHLAGLIRRDVDADVEQMPGAGAAGGLGAGLVAFCGAKLRRGVESVGQVVDLAGKVAGADLVITGEGRLDDQSLRGKVIWGVASAAKAAGAATIGLGGQIGPCECDLSVLLDSWFCIIDRPMPLAQALADAPRLLRQAGERVLRLYLLGKRIQP